MATYYKYADREAGSQVNWAEIGKNLTDTLSEENKLLSQNLKELKIRLARVENEKKELEEKYNRCLNKQSVLKLS